MKSDVLISIIIPVYNVQEYLSRSIESILKQSYYNFELLLIDDGSTDNSSALCDFYSKKDNRIKVFHINNSGVSTARNIGLKMSSGEYIWFIDSDDYIEDDSLKIISDEIIYSRKDYYIIGYNKVYSDNRIVNVKYKKNKIKNTDDLFCNEKYGIRGFVWNKIIKKDIITKPFDEKIFIMEDLIFLLDNLSGKSNFSIIDDVFYNYFQRKNSALNGKDMKLKKYLSIMTASLKIEKSTKKYSYLYKYRFCSAFLKACDTYFEEFFNNENYESYSNYFEDFVNSYFIESGDIILKIKLFIKKIIYKNKILKIHESSRNKTELFDHTEIKH